MTVCMTTCFNPSAQWKRFWVSPVLSAPADLDPAGLSMTSCHGSGNSERTPPAGGPQSRRARHRWYSVTSSMSGTKISPASRGMARSVAFADPDRMASRLPVRCDFRIDLSIAHRADLRSATCSAPEAAPRLLN